MKKTIFIILALILIIFLLYNFSNAFKTQVLMYCGFCGYSTFGSCDINADCITSGCSGENCQSKTEEMGPSSCVVRDCYPSKDTECKCISKKCQWDISILGR